MRILLLSRYAPLGSTSRLRFYQYLPYLEDHGLEVTVSPLLSDEYVRRLYASRRQPVSDLLRAYGQRTRALLTAGSYDLVWVEKEFLPWLPAIAPALLRTPYVADYDDAAFHRYDLHASALVRSFLGKKIDRVMRGAALVVAGNEYLAARAMQAGAGRVEILPTVIDTGRYQPADRPEAGFTIGWIGAPVTVRYLKAIGQALAAFFEQHPDAVIRLIGAADPFDGRFPVQAVPWSEETEVAELQRCDVGIMPLPDEPFERGKCGYKLIQYMGCGLPVVASPVGVNRQIVVPGVNGYLADSQEDWLVALEALHADPALRKVLGAAGRKKAEAAYSLQTAAPKLLHLLQSSMTR